VHEFGLNLQRILEQSVQMRSVYCEPASTDELLAMVEACSPDMVLYNFYPCTMQWVSLRTLNAVRARGLKQATIFHEVPVTGFDAFLYADPTFSDHSARLCDWFSIGRPLPLPPEGGEGNRGSKVEGRKQKSARRSALDTRPAIGTAGFGFGWKGHARLVEMVVREFDKAKIRVHLPFAKHGDADGAGALAIADQCRALIAGKGGIELEIDHDFLPGPEFVKWLSQNDLNAFLYDEVDVSRGIASTSDHALAARRPIALTHTRMFRHLHDVEGIWVDAGFPVGDEPTKPGSLREIMALGIEPLRPVYERFSDENVLKRVEEIIGEIIHGGRLSSDAAARGDTRPPRFNGLLTNDDRRELMATIDWMTAMAPEMMARKIPSANVQQAWALEMVWRCKPQRILCVGCFEDTAFEALNLSMLEKPVGIDASTGDDLATWRTKNPELRFDCVFAISVIEHVADDETFIRDLCAVLRPDGVCILTADYKADWKAGDPLPATDVRFYTPADVSRIGRILEEQGCYFVDKPDLSGAPDFHYQGHDYSFLALTFKKL
jgi:hypothetical protein